LSTQSIRGNYALALPSFPKEHVRDCRHELLTDSRPGSEVQYSIYVNHKESAPLPQVYMQTTSVLAESLGSLATETSGFTSTLGGKPWAHRIPARSLEDYVDRQSQSVVQISVHTTSASCNNIYLMNRHAETGVTASAGSFIFSFPHIIALKQPCH
jgi:hypothetical protein